MTTDTHVVTLIGGEADGRRIQVQGWPETVEVAIAARKTLYGDEVRPGRLAKYRRRVLAGIVAVYIADGVSASTAVRKLLQGYRA